MLLQVSAIVVFMAAMVVGTPVQAHLPVGHFTTRNFNCTSDNGSAFVCLSKDIQTFTTKNFVCVSQGMGQPFKCTHK